MPRKLSRLGQWLATHATLELARDVTLLLLFVAWAGGLAMLWGQVPLGALATLWGIWAVAFAVVVFLGWVRLCGPLLIYDLVRIARRRRYILVRTAYAVALLLLLAALYSYWTWDPKRVGQVTAPELTRFAEAFFYVFMCAGYLAVLLLTPAYTAGAVAVEKDRQTLEFLLATDLHKREIILSKLATRVANLAMLVLAGLPVLSFTQFFGGIDPDLVLTGFAMLGLTMLSLAAVSILHSVHARRSRTAIILTYLTTALYLGLGFLAAEYVPEAPVVASWGLRFDWRGTDYIFTVQSLVDALNSGNLIVALRQLVNAWTQKVALTTVLPGIVLRYAIFHTAIALLCTVWAILRVRQGALPTPAAPPQHDVVRGRWWQWPRMESNPLLWKELVIDPGFYLHRIARMLIVALAVASFVPAVATCYNFLMDQQADREAITSGPTAVRDAQALREREQLRRFTLRKDIQEWVKTIGTLVACVTLLAVALRAAGSVSGERDRQTLDSLLTTPLNRDNILYSKWLASILSVRWTWLWLALLWAVGLGAGGLSVYAVPLLVWAWVVYAMFAANLGLWFSTVCRSTMRATIGTLMTLVCVCFAHWLLLGCYLPFFLYSSGKQDESPLWVIAFQKYGLTPPLTLAALAFQLDDLKDKGINATTFTRGEGLGVLLAAVAGIVVYGVAASILWKLASIKFRILGIAQPLHQGIFPNADKMFPDDEESRRVIPEAIVQTAGPVPLALPVGEAEKPELRGAIMVEEHEEKPSDSGSP